MNSRILLPLLLAALGGASAAPVQTLKIEMADFVFKPTGLNLTVGTPVRILLSNSGKVVHEFQSYLRPRVTPKGEAAWDAYMGKYTLWGASKDVKLTVNGKAVAGRFFEVKLKPGEHAVLSFTPTQKGQFEEGCHLPGHYEGGMKGAVQVR